MSLLTIMLFGIIVLLAHFLEGITGFGCTVLAMPFAILLTGIKIAKPVLTLYGLILCLYIVIISYKNVVWEHFFKILLFVGLGLPVGIWLFNKFPESILKKILAIFMILISIRGLVIIYKENNVTKPVNNKVLDFILFIGGCIHGAFTSGGPLVIIYASEKLKNKSNFRATLCLLWVCLNSIILIQSILNGAFSSDAIKLSIYSFPFLVVGAVLGNLVHHKINNELFTKLVYFVLLISAFFMFL